MIATMGFEARPLAQPDAEGARSGADAGARFAALAEPALDRAYRLAGLLLGSGAEAEDAVGDALERAWRELATLRESDRFVAWFDRIVANTCRDRLRRRARIRFVVLEGGHSPTAPDEFRRVLDGDEALQALAGLTDDERAVVVLHFWADLTLEAVADRLDAPIGTVKSRLHRALQRMRTSMAGTNR